MNTSKHKIVVLSNLKDSTATSLNTAISLAKKTNASIHLFHVKKPSDIVSTDNQLSANRAINTNFTKINKDINELVSTYSKKYNIDITSSFTFGNIKNEIDTFLENSNPNIIVIGKRRNKSIVALGDKISRHLLKKKGKTIIIASSENNLTPENEISLGIYNELEQRSNDFITEIIENSNKPLKNLKVDKKDIKSLETKDINLLLVDRENVKPKSTKSFNKLLRKIDISLVVAN
ncbi:MULTISPECIES: universal stress protein [Tenacibaculum]|uniref:universal stress protein n=1 Tax=Tenacibaculum TaxID=104267 RepID=UPI000894A437|nr:MULTISPECIES: universal stress protein [unclassified Tenacibaculum]RBW59734.1 universal stress protein [Tenacibaculum sp. E3R01]SED93392.1 Universal stress protein family protein [Tenacibaculum sp. MAR_2010_89]